MENFDDAVIADFLRRSYFTVDGLWFVRIEAEHSLEEALRLDEQVWRIMPKIQARKARELLGTDGRTLNDLVRCLELKFAAEGYESETAWPSEHEAEITISACPWFAILQRSGREAIAGAIADAVCANEFAGWAKEFSDRIDCTIEQRLCTGAGKCVLRFRELDSSW